MKNKGKTRLFEKISITLCLLLVVALLAYFVRYFYTHYDTTDEHIYASNVPVIGTVASITSISTHWVTKEGEDTHYPVAIITLDPDSSKSGTLRTYFKSGVGTSTGETKVMGDSNSFNFKNGLFSNGKNSIEVQGSKGLYDRADFLSYRAQEMMRWTIEVLEASSDNPSDFKQLAHAPIEPIDAE